MRWIPKPAAAAVAGVMLTGLLAACGGGSSGGQPTITIGYQPDLHGAAPLLIAQREGFFKKAGLNVKLVQFSSGPPLFAALSGGSLDFGYEGPGVAATVIKGGGEILTVDSLNRGDEVIANPGINTVSDLKGKTVGVVLGTSAQMILDLALKQAGVPTSSVKEVNFTPAAAASAYESHHIAALALWIPPIVPAVAAVQGTKVLVTDKNFIPSYQFPQYWLTMKSYAKSHPETVTKFLQAWIMADNWRASHTSQIVNIVSSKVGIPASSLQPQVGATQWLTASQLGAFYKTNAEYDWYTKLENFFVTDKLLPAVVPPQQFVNTSFFMKALRADHLG
jgi:sulfonate transport system substrate-binding protein